MNSKDHEFREKAQEFLITPKENHPVLPSTTKIQHVPQNVPGPSCQMRFYDRNENSRHLFKEENYLKGINRD